MLAPKRQLSVYVNANMIMIQRQGKPARLYQTTTRGMVRLYRVINQVVNQLHGPRIEVHLGGFWVQW